MKKAFWIVFALLLASVALNVVQWCKRGSTMQQAPTQTYIDTIAYYKPVARDSVVLRYKTETLPIANRVDTVVVRDSIEVVVPIVQTVYEDSTYRAYVSGFDAQLDSIFVAQKTEVVTVTKVDTKRWHLGVSAGYSYTPAGWQPYIGLGLTFSLFGF